MFRISKGKLVLLRNSFRTIEIKNLQSNGSFLPDVKNILANMIVAPSGTIHYKIISAGAEIDFEAETFVVENSETAILLWDSAPSFVIDHTNMVIPASTKPLFLALGVEFYQEVNEQMYILKNSAYNPLALVQVSGL